MAGAEGRAPLPAGRGRTLSPAARDGALAREVAALAWPAVLHGLVGTLVLFTDRLALGRFGPEALGSMQVSGPVVWSAFSLSGAFAVGTLAVLGRLFGAGEGAAAAATARQVFALALGVGALTALLGLALAEPLAAALAAEATAPVRAAAVEYMRVVFAAGPLMLLTAGATATLQAAGDTRTPLAAGAAAALVNLAITWPLTFGHWGLPRLGVVGAALGTVAAFGVQAVWLFLACRRRLVPARGQGRLGAVLRLSGPALAEKVLYHAGFLVFAGFIGRLGDAAMAAHQALLAVESLGFIAADGFGVAAGAIVARKLGAGDVAAAEAGQRRAQRLGVLTLCGVGLLFLVAAEPLVALFSEDPAVRALGARCLRVAAVAQPLMAWVDALAYGLRGAGDTRTPLRAALVGPVAVRLVACWVLAFELELGLLGIWIGSTCDWAVRGVWLARAFRRGAWKGLRW